MPTISEYLGSLRPRTAREYKNTYNCLQKWQENAPNSTFAHYLRSNNPNLSANTIAKHTAQARTLCRHCNLNYDIPIITRERRTLPTFTDTDFQNLYAAFADCPYPKFIVAGERQRYWHTLLHFAAVTAVRRQAILGIGIDDVNFNETYVTITEDNDKKHQERYKPITADLAADLLDLLRFYDKTKIPKEQHKRLFPWGHGNSKWYQCWNAAEKKIGKRFHLHDLKRFSGELALRAGATPLELQRHMDHADINTTLKYYCRPTTTALIKKIKVPIPDRKDRLTPVFTEPELAGIIETMVNRRLKELGVDVDNLQLDEYGIPILQGRVPKQSRQPRQTKPASLGKPVLRVFWGDDEEGGAL